MNKTHVSIATFFLLWGAFFIELAVPLFIGLLIALVSVYIGVLNNKKVDVLAVLVGANIFYWLFSGFITGSLDLVNFIDMKFYNGDGRIFIALAPLILLSIRPLTYGDLRRVLNTILYMSVAGVALFIFWVVTGASWLAGAGHADEFHGLLSSHTGAGTFFGTLCAFCMIYGYDRKSIKILLLGLLLMGPVIGSGSREALLGLIILLCWYLVIRNPNPKIILSGILAAIFVVAALPYVSEKTYNRTADLISWEFVQSTVQQAETSFKLDWAVGDWTPDGGEENLEDGDVTSLVRILLWTYAAKKIAASPIVGMGWGRFNDLKLKIYGVPGIAMIAGNGEARLSTSSAHNSYFQIFAESGLVGFVMFFSIWVSLYRRMKKSAAILKLIPELRAYFVAAQGLVVYSLGCAITGHALASPSLMIPVLTIIGAGIAFARTNIKKNPENDSGDMQYALATS